jgi:hypothetical protein
MDMSDALATAGISATVSVLVSLAAVATVTVRQERAKRREAARVELATLARPLRDRVARYRFAAEESAARFPGRTMREPGGPIESVDFDDVIAILRAIEPFPWWRRALVERRLRKIYGNGLVEVVRGYPISSDKPGEAGMSTWLRVSVAGIEWKDSPTESLMHRTLSQPPSPHVGKALARQLELLSRGR